MAVRCRRGTIHERLSSHPRILESNDRELEAAITHTARLNIILPKIGAAYQAASSSIQESFTFVPFEKAQEVCNRMAAFHNQLEALFECIVDVGHDCEMVGNNHKRMLEAIMADCFTEESE